MSQLEVDKVIPQSGTTLTLGDSADTITIPSGATLDASNATVTIPAVNLTTGVTGTLPVANGGTNLTSGFANGITEADMWRITTSLTLSTSTTDITTNLERVDTNGFEAIGIGMTESSGIFTFPSTGVYLIKANFTGEDGSNTPQYILGNIATTTNNSSYVTNSRSHSTVATTGDAFGFSVDTMFNVTNTTTHKVKFQYESASATTIFYGNTTKVIHIFNL
jgi:hypothetical protein